MPCFEFKGLPNSNLDIVGLINCIQNAYENRNGRILSHFVSIFLLTAFPLNTSEQVSLDCYSEFNLTDLTKRAVDKTVTLLRLEFESPKMSSKVWIFIDSSAAVHSLTSTVAENSKKTLVRLRHSRITFIDRSRISSFFVERKKDSKKMRNRI